MPIYEYYCESCDNRFEKLRPIVAAGQPQPCPRCSRPAGAAITRPARITGVGEPGAVDGDGFGDEAGGLGHDHGHGHSHGPMGHTH